MAKATKEVQDAAGLPERAAAICATQILKMQKEGVDPTAVYLIPFDQNPDRADFCSAKSLHKAPCVTPGGSYLLMPAKRPLTAVEKGRLQGFGPAELDFFRGAPEALLHDLFGNAFATTVFSAALVGMLHHWQRRV